MPEITLCAACATPDLRYLKDYHYAAGERFAISVPGLELFECGACGLIQVNHEFLNEEALISYYKSGYRGDGHSSILSAAAIERKLVRGRELVNTVKPFVRRPEVVFEFGAGHLCNLAAAHEAWPSADLYSDDPDLAAASNPVGAQINHTTIDAMCVNIDLMILCHVLEHLKHPVKMLRMMAGKMDSGACIVIEVPNEANNFFYRRGPLDPHVSFFTPSALTAMFESQLSDLYELKLVGTAGPSPRPPGLQRRGREIVRWLKRALVKRAGIDVVNPMVTALSLRTRLALDGVFLRAVVARR